LRPDGTAEDEWVRPELQADFVFGQYRVGVLPQLRWAFILLGRLSCFEDMDYQHGLGTKKFFIFPIQNKKSKQNIKIIRSQRI
jgi:hypothetical protein